MVIGALGIASIGANLASALISARSARKAASAQKHATRNAMAMYERQREDANRTLQPWMAAGLGMLSKYQSLAGGPQYESFAFDASQLENDAGYRFARDQGLSAVDRGSASGGQYNSSYRDRAASGYAGQIANQFTGSIFQRQLSEHQQNQNQIGQNWQGQRGIAGDLVNIGANAANARVSVGNNITGATAGLTDQLGNAMGQSHLNRGAAWANASSGIAGVLMNQAYMDHEQKLSNQIYGTNTGGMPPKAPYQRQYQSQIGFQKPTNW